MAPLSFGDSKKTEEHFRKVWNFINQSADTLSLRGETIDKAFPLHFKPKEIGQLKSKMYWVDSLIGDVDGDGLNDWLVQTRNKIYGLNINRKGGVKTTFQHDIERGLHFQRSKVANGILFQNIDDVQSFSFDHVGVVGVTWDESQQKLTEHAKSEQLDYCGLSNLKILSGTPFWVMPLIGRLGNTFDEVVKLECVRNVNESHVFIVANGNELWGDCRAAGVVCEEGQLLGLMLKSIGYAIAVGDTNNDGVLELYVSKDSKPEGRDRVTVWELRKKGLIKKDSFAFNGGVKHIVIGDLDNDQKREVWVVVGKSKNNHIWRLN